MGKHASWTASSQRLAKSLLVKLEFDHCLLSSFYNNILQHFLLEKLHALQCMSLLNIKMFFFSCTVCTIISRLYSISNNTRSSKTSHFACLDNKTNASTPLGITKTTPLKVATVLISENLTKCSERPPTEPDTCMIQSKFLFSLQTRNQTFPGEK